MKASALLREAAKTIDGRRRTYGDPKDHVRRVAARWSVTLGRTVTPHEVCLCMLDLKIERLRHDSSHRDSKIDIAGYAGILSELDTITPRKGRK